MSFVSVIAFFIQRPLRIILSSVAMAIWQRHVPSCAGKFCIHQVEADRAERWGAFFIPHRACASGLPKDLRDYRIWDTRELREHLLDSCTRTRLLEIAEQMKVTPSSSSCSKPSRKDLAKFIADACVLPPADAEPCQNTHIDRLRSSSHYDDMLRRIMEGEDTEKEIVEKVLTFLSDTLKKKRLAFRRRLQKSLGAFAETMH